MEAVTGKLLEQGDKFYSFKELEDRLALHMEESCTIFWKRDVRTLSKAAKNVPRAATCNQDLRYYFVKYACNHGGKKFVSKSVGSTTRKSSSFKNGCGAFLLFILSDDGQSLFLKTESSVHNHPIVNRHIFKQILHKRLSRRILAKEKSNRITEKNSSQKTFAKIPTTRVNLTIVSDERTLQSYQMETLDSENILENCAELLDRQYKCHVETLSSPENVLKAIFFQDRIMKETYDAYPEILFVDCTFKVVKICVTFCLFMVLNSVGVCDVVATAVLYSDDYETLDWVASMFKEQNRKWAATSTIMTDRDPTERAVLKHHFPNATSLISTHHMSQSFKRDINAKKLGITQGEEIVSRGYLQKLTDSPNEQAYDSVYCEMMDTLPRKVLEYYHKNWHDIRTQWVYGYSQKSCAFFVDISCRVEALCKRFHRLISKFTTVQQFLIGLFAQISIQRKECDDQALALIPMKFNKCALTSTLAEYYDKLTDFAFNLVEAQFKQVENLKTHHLDMPNGSNFLFKTTFGDVIASAIDCECSFFAWLWLPCQHMFFVRQCLLIDLFDLDARAQRWTRDFCLTDKSRETDEESVDSQRVERHSTMLNLTDRVADLCSKAGDREFDERVRVLNDLISFWKKGKKVQVLELIEPEFLGEVEVNDL